MTRGTSPLFDGLDRVPPRGGSGLLPRPPSQPGSDTSEAAAAAIEPEARTLRDCVRGVIEGAAGWGATDEEIGNALGRGGNTIRPRRRELETMGMVRDSGRRRRGASGRLAVVWEIDPTRGQGGDGPARRIDVRKRREWADALREAALASGDRIGHHPEGRALRRSLDELEAWLRGK